MTGRYVCIHCHFYQPPRENAWLEDVELQDSAYPYHDWNTRITQECYRCNAASRILGPEGRIIDIVNNYASISFNFGPTLLYWLQSHAPDVYDKVIEADRTGRARFSGHGGALAQVYNHIIMPLANARDKETQVRWAIADFRRHFGREPEGMWLPETAVDTPTLEVLAGHGLRFTILSPRQVQRVRKPGQRWRRVGEGTLDTSTPYLCNLPSGKRIVLFFYNGPISFDVAYGEVLRSGEGFASRLAEAFVDGDATQLVHIATDGESFGHHHARGEMALAYCIHAIQSKNLARITNYGEYLEKFPPESEVEIQENSSWSCAHGVERWRSNCGCAINPDKSGQQEWRQPLRTALDWLRDTLVGPYEEAMHGFTGTPWEVRDAYIDVINDRRPENVDRFIRQWAGREPNDRERSTFLKLLEMQRNAMLMYTSCGWFFDDLSGIEAVQVLQYASRAMQLCYEVTGLDLESDFEGRLEGAPAGASGVANGRQVYEAQAKPARIDLNRVGAHFAISSVFEEYGDKLTDIFAYSATTEECHRSDAGIQALITSRATIRSRITLETRMVELAALYLGDTNVFASVWPRGSDEEFQTLRHTLEEAFRRGDTSAVIRQMSQAFGGQYSLSHLFKDELRRILDRLLANTWDEIESDFRRIYEHNYTIMQMLLNANTPVPKGLRGPAEFVIDRELLRHIRADPIEVGAVRDLAEEAGRFSLNLDLKMLRFESARRIGDLMRQLKESPYDLPLLAIIKQVLEVLQSLTPDLDTQDAQNVFFGLARQEYAEMTRRAASQDQHAVEWVKHFEDVAELLKLALP
ncbi:MAG: DUF3536 domain-containing protein [Phycisphaerae bacterium]|nr:DUF3536 domain-containing protein [Phycisphaerae bacterium]